MSERGCCSNCGAEPPEESILDTSWSKYGWRVSRQVTESGVRIDFFCPSCWKAKKSDLPPQR